MDIEEEWKIFRQSFVRAAERVVGRRSGKVGVRREQQWWWNNEVKEATKRKRNAWKAVESVRDDVRKKEKLR